MVGKGSFPFKHDNDHTDILFENVDQHAELSWVHVKHVVSCQGIHSEQIHLLNIRVGGGGHVQGGGGHVHGHASLQLLSHCSRLKFEHKIK